MQHCFGKESALGAGGGGERVALIKSLIYARRKNEKRVQGCQVQLKMSAYRVDNNMDNNACNEKCFPQQ
jgi:hypothetical protein